MQCKRTAMTRDAEFLTREAEDGARYIEGYFAVYAIKQKEKAELAKINAEKKAKKIAKDKAKREEKGN